MGRIVYENRPMQRNSTLQVVQEGLLLVDFQFLNVKGT
jgi:hypothetical protein